MSQKEERITEEGFGRKENIREYCTVWKNIEGVHNSVVHFLKEKSFFIYKGSFNLLHTFNTNQNSMSD